MLVVLLSNLALATPMNPIQLSTLADKGTFEITVGGELQTSFIGKKSCVWFEWDIGEGERTDGAFNWHTWSNGYNTEGILLVHTAHGTVELSWRKMRLAAKPTTEELFSPKTHPNPPPYVKAWWERHAPAETYVAEYCLQPEKTYWARVDEESHKLPPRDEDGEPVRRTNTTLIISDEPFDVNPKSALTPVFSSWGY
jgi:hypothetical protein